MRPSTTGTQDHNEGNTGSLSRSEAKPGPYGQPPGLQIGCTKNKGESLQIPVTVNGVPSHAVINTGERMLGFGLQMKKTPTKTEFTHSTILH